jgi:hypothetical protein
VAASINHLLSARRESLASAGVTKTFAAHGKRNAIEVICAIGYDISMIGTVSVDDDDSGTDDLWRLKD